MKSLLLLIRHIFFSTKKNTSQLYILSMKISHYNLFNWKSSFTEATSLWRYTFQERQSTLILENNRINTLKVSWHQKTYPTLYFWNSQLRRLILVLKYVFEKAWILCFLKVSNWSYQANGSFTLHMMTLMAPMFKIRFLNLTMLIYFKPGCFKNSVDQDPHYTLLK